MTPTLGSFGQPGSSGGDDRQRVLDATDIVRLVGEQIALKQKGKEFVCLCPFHDDHSPSMYVVPSKQFYKCFSCGASGNALGFVMNYHKMEFREALEYLAERAGITLTPFRRRNEFSGAASSSVFSSSSDEPAPSSGLTRSDLAGAAATAQGFFRAILNHAEHGRLAREAIAKRAISPEMVEQFGIGAAPDKWDGLTLTIGAKSVAPEPFLAAGLLKRRENSGGSGMYDAFRNRLMFPIHDPTGRVIGFGGRRLNDADEPKYINSPESALFDKSTTLYGMYQAGQAIRQSRVAIVTEGYMDTIACHQAGIKNAVATLGTALTPGNARVLRRQCDTVILLFDGDQAGMKAAERGVEVFFAEPVDVKIAMLSSVTDAKDPDELLKRPDGRAEFDKVIAAAIEPMELLFNRVKAQIDGLGLSAKSRVIDEFLQRLVELGLDRVDKVRYQLIVKRVSQIAGVDWETIAATLNQHRMKHRGRVQAAADRKNDQQQGQQSQGHIQGHIQGMITEQRPMTAAEHLLGCILNDPSLLLSLGEEQWELIEPEAFDGASRKLAECIAEMQISEVEPSVQNVLAHCPDEAVTKAAAALCLEVDQITGSSADVLKRHWRDRLADAQAQRDAARRSALKPAVPAANSWRDNIERLREQRSGRGNDPRALPRPPT